MGWGAGLLGASEDTESSLQKRASGFGVGLQSGQEASGFGRVLSNTSVHQKEPAFPCCRWRLLGAVTDFGQGQRIRNSEVKYR